MAAPVNSTVPTANPPTIRADRTAANRIGAAVGVIGQARYATNRNAKKGAATTPTIESSQSQMADRSAPWH